MNGNWLSLDKSRRVELLNQASALTGLPSVAIEKDWWVTLVLKASFSLPYSNHIVFKGGTSLSKGWDLIERFSEDIDLAIDRKYLGFKGDISLSQVSKLRRHSCNFVSTVFLQDLTEKLTELGAMEACTLFIQTTVNKDKDPQTIEVDYQSVLEKSGYLPQRVLVEIGARSLIGPVEERNVKSIMGTVFPQFTFGPDPFTVATVMPQRTFLEKIFLLHEEFSQRHTEVRIDRLSRHLYDLEKLMDTGYGLDSLKNKELYDTIVAHRRKFNAIRGLDYDNHVPSKVGIVPPDEVKAGYKKDYEAMTTHMIYGNHLSFEMLMTRIAELQLRINNMQ